MTTPRVLPVCHICRMPILGRSLLIQKSDYRYPRSEVHQIAIRVHPLCLHRSNEPQPPQAA